LHLINYNKNQETTHARPIILFFFYVNILFLRDYNFAYLIFIILSSIDSYFVKQASVFWVVKMDYFENLISELVLNWNFDCLDCWSLKIVLNYLHLLSVYIKFNRSSELLYFSLFKLTTFEDIDLKLDFHAFRYLFR
jgi:hypothetical protein